MAEKVFEDYDSQLRSIFSHFAKKRVDNGFSDEVLQVDEALDIFRKAGVVADAKPAPLKLEEFIDCIERFYSPEQKLSSKLANEEAFQGYLNAHYPLQQVEEGEEQPARDETEPRAKWTKQVICEHLVSLRGVELVYFEFRELIFDLAASRLPRELVDPKKSGKVKVFLPKFLEEIFLKRLGAFIRHVAANPSQQAPAPARKWPESDKDRIIRLKLEEKRRVEEEARAAEAERRRQQAELDALNAEAAQQETG